MLSNVNELAQTSPLQEEVMARMARHVKDVIAPEEDGCIILKFADTEGEKVSLESRIHKAPDLKTKARLLATC